MIIYLNGRFVPEEQATISVHDRGFLYGDGLFETVRIYGGEPFLWREHVVRFEAGARTLGIHPPLSPGEMRVVLRELLRRNDASEAVARITLSRGAGPRGYSPRGATHPTLAILMFPAASRSAESCRVVTSSFRLTASDPLAAFKHANKLVQVMARAEADAAGADEAILLNDHGHVVEGASSNLFWVRGGELCTAPLAGILGGTTRSHVLRLARQLSLPVREEFASLHEVKRAEGVFVTSSAVEVLEVAEWDRLPVRRSPLVEELEARYRPAAS